MMRAVPVLTLFLLAGCPSDEGNPDVLWLALDGSELEVRLLS